MIMDNNKTVTMKMSSPIDTPDGSYDLSFRVSIRNGASSAMIAETVAHWLCTAMVLGIGELKCGNDFVERSEYDLSEHGQNRIVIFGDMRVFTASGLRLLPVNVFSETTSAQDFVNFAWGVMDGMGQIAQLPNTILFAGSINAGKPKPQSELDNHFGERKPQQQAPAPDKPNGGAVAAPKDVVGERQIFERLPKDVREELERESIGQVIGLHVSAVERKLHKWDDGNTEEQIVFWRLDGEYAYNYRTVIKVDDREHNYDLKVFKKTGLLEQLPGAGYKIPISGLAYFKLNKGTGDYADKVYWNFHSYVAGEVAPSAQASEELAAPRDVDEIPF